MINKAKNKTIKRTVKKKDAEALGIKDGDKIVQCPACKRMVEAKHLITCPYCGKQGCDRCGIRCGCKKDNKNAGTDNDKKTISV